MLECIMLSHSLNSVYTLCIMFSTLHSNDSFYWRAGASLPSHATGPNFLYIIGERERAYLVMQLARIFCTLLASGSEPSLPSRATGTIFLYIIGERERA